MLFTVDLYGTNFHHWMKIQWEYHIIIPQKVAKYLNNFVNLVVGRHYVLVSTGIELTFLLAAGMVLCLGLRMRTLLITLRRTVLIQGQGLLSFSFCPASEEPEGAQGAGREHNQDSWPTLAKGMSHTTLCCAEQWNWGELNRRVSAHRGIWGPDFTFTNLRDPLLCILTIFFNFYFSKYMHVFRSNFINLMWKHLWDRYG